MSLGQNYRYTNIREVEIETVQMDVAQLVDCPMETRRSWVQPLHSTVASSELGDMVEVIEK